MAKPLNSLLQPPHKTGRSKLLMLLISLGLVSVGAKAFSLQHWDAESWQKRGERIFEGVREIPASRGSIVDRNGVVLATSVPYVNVGVSLRLFEPRFHDASALLDPRFRGHVERINSLSGQERRQAMIKLAKELGVKLDVVNERINHLRGFERLAQITQEDLVGFIARSRALQRASGAARVKDQSDPPKLQNYFYLKRDVSLEQAEAIERLRLPGVQLEREWRREYPRGAAFGHIVGVLGKEEPNDKHSVGLLGVERWRESVLAGKPGERRVIQDSRSRAVEEIDESLKLPEDGKSIQLSIDADIQSIAWQALNDAVIKHRADTGTVIVIDSESGEILALAIAPSFDPKDMSRVSNKAFRNIALSDAIEPGSTLKPFTVATALQHNVVTPTTVIDTSPGDIVIDRNTITDRPHNYGRVTVAKIVQKSSNVGTSKIALQLKPELMYQGFIDVGFGVIPDLEIGRVPTRGRVRPYSSWTALDRATMSFGHSITVSPLQLAHAYTVFARDGDLAPLTLFKRDDLRPGERAAGKEVYSPQIAQALREMLEAAASEEGTGRLAKVAGYRVAGKTGTAHKVLEKGGYAPNQYISSFVGFAPAHAPRLVVAVVIDNPKGGQHYGGRVAAPVFSAVVSESLRSLKVPPESSTKLATASVAKAPAR